MHLPVTSHKKQRGVVIVVALVMLLGMTILSVTSMTNSRLEERMSANLRDREIALQAAEAALRYGERIAPTIALGSFDNNCTSGNCNFNLQGSGPFPVYWTDATLDVWNNTSRYKVYNLTIAELSTSAPPRFIVEYMGKQIQDLSGGAVTSDPPVFRITALGFGQSINTRVMLQSTFIPN